MNKELLDLLEKINAKKDEVKNLANEGKLEEAKKAKDELKELQFLHSWNSSHGIHFLQPVQTLL